MTKFTVRFVKNTGVQIDPSYDVASFPVNANTKSEAIRTALEMWRTGNLDDDWDLISVTPPWDWSKKV